MSLVLVEKFRRRDLKMVASEAKNGTPLSAISYAII